MADMYVAGKKVVTTITGKKKYILIMKCGGKTIETPVTKGTFDGHRVGDKY